MAPRTQLIAARKQILDTQKAPKAWEDEFTATEQREHLPPGLLRAVALSESGWNDKAESPAGAYGLMQFMPDTAKDFNVDRTSAKSSIQGAGRYLRQLIDRYGGDVGLALSAYNGGPGNVDRWLQTGHWSWNRKKKEWNSRPKENRDYAHIILGTMGYDYSNNLASPLLGAKKFIPNAKGKNTPYIMPDGTVGQLSPIGTATREASSPLAQLLRETHNLPPQYNVGLPNLNNDISMPLDYEQRQEFLDPSASVLPIPTNNIQAIEQNPAANLDFTIPTQEIPSTQLMQAFNRGINDLRPQLIR